MPGFYDFAAQSCSPPGQALCPQHPAGSPCVLGASGHCGSWCWLGPSETRCIGAEQWSLPQGWGCRCWPPWCSDGSAAWESFLFLLVSMLNFPVSPMRSPWIGVKSALALHQPLRSAWERDRPGSGPSGGDGGTITSTPLPSHCADWGCGTHQLRKAGHGHGTRPFLQRKEVFLTTTKKKIPTLNMFFKKKQRLEIL